eukprot:TRINITY_DN471_c0_g1_i5.p1 TRINITY_DN471_c0_g1~~TRINITY_DN471_c0_g1_i5.p1  ORF type:complete len:186 (-),score=38.63 TRINITY_DN471_c0_g1_i5:47-604(-)
MWKRLARGTSANLVRSTYLKRTLQQHGSTMYLTNRFYSSSHSHGDHNIPHDILDHLDDHTEHPRMGYLFGVRRGEYWLESWEFVAYACLAGTVFLGYLGHYNSQQAIEYSLDEVKTRLQNGLGQGEDGNFIQMELPPSAAKEFSVFSESAFGEDIIPYQFDEAHLSEIDIAMEKKYPSVLTPRNL